MVSQILLLIGQGLNLYSTQVPVKWQPVVLGALSLTQISLAYIAHHYTPSGEKIQ